MPVINKNQSINLYQKIIDNEKLFDSLSEEQQDVLTYLAEGMTFKEIAIGSETTKNHVMHIRNTVFRKLGYKINNGCSFLSIVKGINNEFKND